MSESFIQTLPNPELMVTLTGICEVLGAIGLLVTRTRRVAASLLIIFLIAVLLRTFMPPVAD